MNLDTQQHQPGDPGSNGARSRQRPRLSRRIASHFQRTLAAGVLVMLPIGITALVLKFIFDLLTPILQPLTDLLPGPDVYGTGLVRPVDSDLRRWAGGRLCHRPPDN